MTTDALVLFGVSAVLLLVLSVLAGSLQLLERRFPAFSRFLDEHVGQPRAWE